MRKLTRHSRTAILYNTGAGKDEDVLFATKRYDRDFSTDNEECISEMRKPYRLHQEDFAQALGIAGADKYEPDHESYLKKIFQILRSNVSDPLTDQLKLWDILVYDFLIGNTDNHIKNLSLLYSEDLKNIRLAPAYDIISTAIYEGSSKEMAIGIGGEKNIDRINRESFLNAAANAGLGKKIALKHFDALAEKFEAALTEAAAELNDQGYAEAQAMKERILKEGGYAHL